jgi:hypothetical protein
MPSNLDAREVLDELAALDPPPHPTRATVKPLIFEPDEAMQACIFQDFHSPHCSLPAIAERCGTSVEALGIWLARPEVAARLDAIESMYARRARLQIADATGNIILAANQVIHNYTKAESTLFFKDDNLRAHAVLTRKAANAMTASKVLLYLAKHFSTTPPRHNIPNTANNPISSKRAQLAPQPAHNHNPNLNPNLPSPSPKEPRLNLSPLNGFFSSLNLQDPPPPSPAGNARPTAPTRPTAPVPLTPALTTNTHDNQERAADSPRSPAATHQNPPAPPPPPTAAKSPQAEGLPSQSRGVQQAQPSDTPGRQASIRPHPEGVHVARADHAPAQSPCGCAQTTKCNGCTPDAHPHRARDPTPTP